MVYTNRSYFYQAVPLTNHMYDFDDDRFSFAVVCCSSKVQGRGRLTTVVVCIRGRLVFAVHWILVSSRSLDVRGRFSSLQVTGAWCEPENPTGGSKNVPETDLLCRVLFCKGVQ